MLHRLPHANLLAHTPLSGPARLARRGAVSPCVQQWLKAPGSLTARLRQHGTVQVHVLRQGRMALTRQEQAAIGTRQGHVREVVLTINGQPAVWARSVTSQRGLKGAWRALKGLGARPLAELLFEHRQVIRDPLWGERLAEHAPLTSHLARSWSAWGGQHQARPTWARRSVFWHKGQALQVMESFSPWVLALPAHLALPALAAPMRLAQSDAPRTPVTAPVLMAHQPR